MLYNVYAQDVVEASEGRIVRRFLGKCEGTNTGSGIFDLYADECGDQEEVVIEQAEESKAAATLGRKGGSVSSPAKSEAAKARNAARKAQGKPEGSRPKKQPE